MTASDAMQSGIISVSPELPLDELEELLAGEEISGAPVTNSAGKVLGVVSKTDIIRFLSEQVAGAFDGSLMAGSCVRDIMTDGAVGVAPDTELRAVAEVMLDEKIHRVLVTEKHEVLGILTTFDVIRGLLAESAER